MTLAGRRNRSAVVAASVLMLAGCTGQQAVQPTGPGTSGLPDPAEPLGLEQLADFSGVATMNAGSNCTGTLVDTGVDAGPAYVLTNGHCSGDLAPGTTTIDKPWFGTAEFLRAAGNLDSTVTADVVQLAYSTMRHTDTAIMRLGTTLGALKDQGIRPVPLTADEPAAGLGVVNVGVPVQNLFEDDWVLRHGECRLGTQHTLIEAWWLWFDAWSNDCPGIIQGSSGSPLFTVDESGAPTAIVGMINTTTWGASSGSASCGIHHPCEVSADGVSMADRTSYAQSVAGLGACFDAATGEFALGVACPLPVASAWPLSGGGSFRGGDLPDSVGRTPEAALVAARGGPGRTAVVDLGDGRVCQDPATYEDATSVDLPAATGEWDDAGLMVPVDLPETEGRFALCAVSGDDYDGAATVLFDVDRTPPTIPADADVERLDGWVTVRPHLNPPEISNVRFTWGPQGSVDCNDTAAFQDFFVVPLHLEEADLPATYCIYGMDAAGNPTPVTRIEIPRD